jgi:ATP-dependent DNA helicase RecQ
LHCHRDAVQRGFSRGETGHRLILARREGAPPYVIAGDRTLREIAVLRPRNLQELELVRGIGPAKRENYGRGLLAVVSGEGAA